MNPIFVNILIIKQQLLIVTKQLLIVTKQRLPVKVIEKRINKWDYIDMGYCYQRNVVKTWFFFHKIDIFRNFFKSF